MKKTNLLFLLGLLSVMTLNLSACSDDEDENSPSEIIGTWECTYNYYCEKRNGEIIHKEENSEIGFCLTFNSDGTCYNSEGDEVNWSYKDGGIYLKDGNMTVKLPVKSLTPTELIIEDSTKYKEDGDTYEISQKMIYKKIPE